MRTEHTFLLLTITLTTVGLNSLEALAQACSGPPNILVIVADDVGVDMITAYGEGFQCTCTGMPGEDCTSNTDCSPGETCVKSSYIGNVCPGTEDPAGLCSDSRPPTPRITILKENGVLFRNAWSDPTCSPTRATIQTGRYGFRTGIGFALGGPAPGLPLCERTIPEILSAATDNYAHAAVGKWHLGDQGDAYSPNLHGYDHFAGTEANLTTGGRTYFSWQKIVDGRTGDVCDQAVKTCGDPLDLCIDPQDGVPCCPYDYQALGKDDCCGYATSANVNDALCWVRQQTDPWFMWLAFNAPHSIYHEPPDELHSYSLNRLSPAGLKYLAMLEALDREIGRFLDSLDPAVLDNTTIIFLGDNGTPGEVIVPPYDSNRAKETVYEGGINVPLIISGAGVMNPGRESGALVNTADLFATILDLAGVDLSALPEDVGEDAVSLVPILLDDETDSLRTYAFSETFRGSTHSDTIRNERGYKVIRFRDAGEIEFYDLLNDPYECTDLGGNPPPGEALDNFNDLCTELDNLTGQDCSIFPAGTQPGCPAACCGTTCVAGPEAEALLPGETEPMQKNRFISFVVNNPGELTAIRVRLYKLYDTDDVETGCPVRVNMPNLSAFDGQFRWVGPPGSFSEHAPPMLNFIAAELQCNPHYRDWSQVAFSDEFGANVDVSTLHVYGDAIVPCSTYKIQIIPGACDTLVEANYSTVLEVGTAKWGDVWEPFGEAGQPTFTDIGKIVEKFQSIPFERGPPQSGAPPQVRALLRENVPPVALSVNFTDIGLVVNAFKKIAYPYDGPAPCVCSGP